MEQLTLTFLEIERMQFALQKYETKYNMTSKEFYRKLENGEVGDDRDFVMWSGIYELLLDSKKQLEIEDKMLND